MLHSHRGTLFIAGANLLLAFLVPQSGPAQTLYDVPFRPDSYTLQPGELKQILGSLCPGEEYFGTEANGCHVCPQQSGSPGTKSDSFIEYSVTGHFLAPQSDDLLVVLFGCEAHTGLFRNFMLFTHSDRGWIFKRAGGAIGQCRKIPNRSGQNGLFCYAEDSHYDSRQGFLSFGYVTVDDQLHMEVIDNRQGACSAAHNGQDNAVIQSAFQSVEFVPLPRGNVIVRISATCRRGLLTPRSLVRCKAGEAGTENFRWRQALRTFRMDYRFDGQDLSLTPLSRAAKLNFDRCVTY